MTTTEKEIDPSDIGKHPDLIKIAQTEMAQTDVLVCGKCHTVFHFVELFKEHKDAGCKRDSTLKDCRETKPKVWAFLLWKASQLNNEDSVNVNSWKLYQTWVKMEETTRETWIVAGRTIQSFGKMGQGSLQEMPVKITKTVVDNSNDVKKDLPLKKSSILNRMPTTQTAKTVQPQLTRVNVPKSRLAKHTLGEDMYEMENVEKILAKRFNPRKKHYEYLVKWENLAHEQNTWEQLSHFDQCKHLLDHFEEQLARQKEQRAKFQQLQQNASAKITSPAVSVNTINSSISPNRPIRNSKSKAIDQVKQWCANEETASISLKRKNQSSADEEEEDDPSIDEEDFGFTPKKIKTENPAVAQALMKAGQSGTVRIVHVNKGNTVNTSPIKTGVTSTKINGSSAPPKIDSNKPSAEIVITKDGKTASGVMKKPGVTINNKVSQSEAKIRVVSKSDNTQSGVVRIVAQQTTPSKPTTIVNKITSNVNRISPNVQTANKVQQQIVQRSGTKSSPTITKTFQQKQTVQQKRLSLSPDVQNKTTVTRIVKSVPNSAKTTPESRVVTYRTSDGQLIRKTIPINTQTQRETNIPNDFTNNDDDDDDDNLSDPFPTELPPPEPESPPLPMSLCPITGKVLMKAEGEKTPPPSPEPLPAKDEKPLEQEIPIEQDKIDDTNQTTLQQLQPMTNEDGTPLIVTGEDGTIYQIAGKNEEGQTILIAQGSDGEQQCVYVAAQEDDENVLALDASGVTDVNQLIPQQEGMEEGQTQYILKQDGDTTMTGQTLTLSLEGADSQDAHITAEVVQAEQPSPGGTRKVVLLLPDGNFMMTEVDEEQYRSLNIAA